MFSVLVCVYYKDDPVIFKEVLQSIYDQTLQLTELVIVVDGPVPEDLENAIRGTESVSEENGYELKIIWLKVNRGHGRARNIGVESCAHDIIVLCDADDYNKAERFEMLHDAMISSQGFSVVGSDVVELSKEFGTPIGRREVKEHHDEIIKDMAVRCPFNQMTVALRKSDVISVGGYRDVFNNEDYDLWIRLATAGFKFCNIKKTLVNATVNQDFYSRRGGIKYFISEVNIQLALYRAGYSSSVVFSKNGILRFLVQVLMPGKMRQFTFIKFARGKINNE